MSDAVPVRWNTRESVAPVAADAPTSRPDWMRAPTAPIAPAPFARQPGVPEAVVEPAPEPAIEEPVDPGPPPPPPYDPATDPERLQAIAELHAAAQALVRARQDFVARAEDDLVALAVSIADAILTDRLSDSPQLYKALAREAIASLEADKPVRFRVSPAAYEATVEALGGARASLTGIDVSVERDDAIEGHGVIAEQGDAIVDGRIRERLEAVRIALAEARGARA